MLVVHRGQRRARLTQPGRMLAGSVADQRGAKRLVERRPMGDAIPERGLHRRRVVTEAEGRFAVRPTAALLESLRQVPVVERKPGHDARRQQLVHQPAVEVETLLVDRAVARLHSRPACGEAVGAQSELFHQSDVLGHSVVMVNGGVKASTLAWAPSGRRTNPLRSIAFSVRKAMSVAGDPSASRNSNPASKPRPLASKRSFGN